MKENTTNERFKTRQEIAVELGIHRDTLRKLLTINNLDIPNGLIAPKDQQRIYYLFNPAI